MAIPALVCSALLALGMRLEACQQERGGVQSLLQTPERHGFAAWELEGDVRWRVEDVGVKEKEKEYSPCQSACALLAALVPGNVTASSSSDYHALPYWSVQQSEVTPACRIDVESAQAISTAIKVSRLTQCPFAVKSGGHAAFAGGSSIQDGILINLGKMNMVELSEDRQTVKVGPGNLWHDVYRQLDPKGVSVVGGREAGVGVGGLILGGGISYFSGRHGWACDNVRNYEVVLADGSIVNASPTSHPSLYWALRGGSGTNFGIVSRFDLASFEQGHLWGGTRIYTMDSAAALATALANFNTAAPSDDYAHLYIAFVHAQGSYIAVSGPAYGKPDPSAPIFAELNAIPALYDLTSIANLTTLSVELNQTAYLREVFKTVTFRNSAPLIQELVALFVQETRKLLHVEGLQPAFAFQPISTNIMDKMSANGGNVLGLDAEDGPLTIMNLNFGWANAEDDGVVHAAVDRFVDECVVVAEAMGMLQKDNFVYMNYATKEQDVFGGYGAANLKRLREVRALYDPEDVFGRLQPGYFKLT